MLPQPLHRHAEMGGRGLTQRHGVQPLGQKRRYDEGCRATIGPAAKTFVQVAPAREPSDQKVRFAQLPVIRHERS